MQTATLVHDIKTKMTVISGNAELLAESARTDDTVFKVKNFTIILATHGIIVGKFLFMHKEQLLD